MIDAKTTARVANAVGLVVTNLPKRKLDGVEIPHSVDWGSAQRFANGILSLFPHPTYGAIGFEAADGSLVRYKDDKHREALKAQVVSGKLREVFASGGSARTADKGLSNTLPGTQWEPIETIEYWLGAYSNKESGEHFMGHGMVVALFTEYLALRKVHEKIPDYRNLLAGLRTACENLLETGEGEAEYRMAEAEAFAALISDARRSALQSKVARESNHSPSEGNDTTQK